MKTTTPRTDAAQYSSSLVDLARQLETELASAQMELGATEGELIEARASKSRIMQRAEAIRCELVEQCKLNGSLIAANLRMGEALEAANDLLNRAGREDGTTWEPGQNWIFWEDKTAAKNTMQSIRAALSTSPQPRHPSGSSVTSMGRRC